MKAVLNQLPLLTGNDHKEIFKQIRNYLAGRFVGATRDRALLEEVVKCFFCKHFLLRNNKGKPEVSDPIILSTLYRECFDDLKNKLPFVFDKSEQIQLDPVSIYFVDGELSQIDFDNLSRDPFGDLYEVFVGTGIREEEGQFFTPQNGVQLLISMVSPKAGEKIIDPAAGAGGFLSAAAQYLKTQGVTSKEIVNSVYGVEKDGYLAKLAATRIAMTCLAQPQICCGDSLAWINESNQKIAFKNEGYFDIVLTNPPFGKNIVSTTKEVQKSFELGYDWKEVPGGTYQRNGKLQANVPPQVLFVERCLTLLKEGGRLGIVLPESLITSRSYGYVVEYMKKNGRFEAVLGMPEDFFKTSGKGGTHTKACLVQFVKEKSPSNLQKLFMAEAKWCGHDSRGRTIEQDDLPIIWTNYQNFKANKKSKPSKLGYTIKYQDIENNVLSPRYYNPDVLSSLKSIENTHNILRIGDLVRDKVLEIKTGNEVGKLAYGTGQIPFVRTSDISNWEIKLDPKHGVSEEFYQLYANKQDVKEGDILMVKDGTYLIGTCAMVSKYDTKIVYQSHLYKLRVLDKKIISPFILLAALSCEFVQAQIKAKRFTQDIIDSLGSRINDLIIPIPKDKKLLKKIEENVRKAIEDRIEARELARQACLDVAAISVD